MRKSSIALFYARSELPESPTVLCANCGSKHPLFSSCHQYAQVPAQPAETNEQSRLKSAV